MTFACSCGQSGIDRRSLLRFGGAAALGLALAPLRVLAAGGDYEAMVLGCIDPRLQTPVYRYLAGRRLSGQYSQFTIAGAAIGVVAPAFAAWHRAFWDNLAISLDLHKIKKVIAIDHRDCGAAKAAYGEAKVANPEIETATHRAALAQFRAEAAQRQPKLAVETGLMALDGSILMFG